MISSGSDNRKKKATRRQVLSLAGGATLALGTLGMMTFGAAATAYAQTPTATHTLTGKLTIGSPSAQPTAPALSLTNPNAGATNDELSFSATAQETLSSSNTSTDRVAASVTLQTPFSATAANTYAEVYDPYTHAILGSTTVGAHQLQNGTTTIDVYASSDTASINAGDPLQVIIGGVTNSATMGTGDVSITLGTMTGTGTTVDYAAAGGPNLVTTQSASTTGTSPTLSLSPQTDPGQVTTLTYTFPVDSKNSAQSPFYVNLESEAVGGSYSGISGSDVMYPSATLSIGGTNETNNVTPSYGSGQLEFTPNAGVTLPSGVYSISVPISGSAVESVAAQYVGTADTSTTFVTASSTAAWGYAIDLSPLTASNPYVGAKSDVTMKFKSNETTDVGLQVAGLGLSGMLSTGQLVDTTTGAPVGAVVFNDANVSSAVSLVAGDSYSLTLSSVTLPTASTAVTVDTMFAPSSTTTLSLGSSATTSMDVSASTTSAGASANWTLSGIETAAALSSGSTLSISDTAVSYYPLSSGDYRVVDLSNSADTQTPTVVQTGSGSSLLTLGTAIPSGDIIEITISGMVNATTSAVSTVSLTATGDYLMAAQVTALSASTEMANGAIANASGALYEWAGAYAFHLPTIADAGKIEAFKGNPTQQKQSVPSTSVFASGDTLTAGTLVQGVQSGTVLAPIYVVGSNGDLYHIASPSAFFGGGYAPKDVVELPQRDIAMMTMAPSGSTPAAYSVHANGSFWQTSGGTSIYEWVGGVAVHVASPADLVSIAHSLGETVLASWPQVSSGTVSASQMAPSVPRMGTVVKVLDGSSAGSMYVSTGSALVPISATQLSSLGYPASDVLEVSTTAGITILG
jgi:hypothetical protein